MISVASSTTQTFDTNPTSSLVLNKPTGLTVGDLMVAVFSSTGGVSHWTKSGWTQYVGINASAGGGRLTILWKVADAGDVAASSFTFSNTLQISGFGRLLRITGANTASPFVANANAETTGSNPSVANTITPVANSLLLMLTWGYQYTAGISGYTIATSNPSWTELDDYGAFTNYTGLITSLAYAVRSQSTATGNSSVTANQSGASNNFGILILAIRPAVVISVADTQSTSDAVRKTVGKRIADTQSTAETVSKTKQTKTSNQAKSSSSWNNQSKS